MLKNILYPVGAIGLIIVALTLFTSPAINHLYHQAAAPTDLYLPIITDTFNVSTPNNVKEYILKPKYSDIYEVILQPSPDTIPSGYNTPEKLTYTGKLKIELYRNQQKTDDMIVTTISSHYYQKNDMNFISALVLATFELEKKVFKPEKITLKLTVLTADSSLTHYQDELQLIVRVSPKP